MILLLLSFVAGLLTVLAPCVLPLLPVIVGGSVGGGKSLKRAITVTVSLALSVISFTLLIKASTLLIGIPATFWTGFSGGIIIAFGLISLFPSLWERMPYLSKLSIESNQVLASGYKKQNIWGDVIVGASLGPVFSTCSPTYFLLLAAVLPENFALGIIYLIAYSVGLSLALLLVAFVGQKILDKAGVVADPRGKFKKILGIIFILVGIAIITGADKTLQIKILDFGYYDVTKIEQKLLELGPTDTNQSEQINIQEEESKTEKATFLSPEEKKKKFVLAPQISTPDGFVNTNGKQITLNELRGKVVLLDIWTYSCINCQRTIPHINDWYTKYKDQGLEIVGLHTPEFAFEQVQKNVENAVDGFNIEYPVVLDNDYSTWNAYGNRFWPRKYLIDIDGYIIYDHIGEGGYEETEKEIQKALAERNARLNIDPPISIGTSKPVDSIDLSDVGSPEIYFGSNRNERLSNGSRGISGIQTFTTPNNIVLNNLYLGGSWNITSEYALSMAESSVIFRYRAKNVYLVAGSDNGTEIEVFQDEKLVKNIFVKEEKLYKLIEDNKSGEHTLMIKIKGTGLMAFTFTFG